MNVLPYAATITAGVLNAIHSGTNAELNRCLARPLWASVLVIVVSGLVLRACALLARETFPAAARLAATPWWAWLGTAIAAVPVLTTVMFAGSLGAAPYNGLVVTATIVCSVLLDHFGVIGFETHRIGLMRALGAAMMVGGVTLISIF